MKKKIISLLIFFCGLVYSVTAQLAPSGNPHPNWNYNDWYRGGNEGLIFGNSPNIFGTFWNSPIYTYTDSQNRTRLNGTLLTTINGAPGVDVSGYFGIGLNNYFTTESP